MLLCVFDAYFIRVCVCVQHVPFTINKEVCSRIPCHRMLRWHAAAMATSHDNGTNNDLYQIEIMSHQTTSIAI